MSKYRYHVLIRLCVQVVYFVSLVKDISKCVWRWRIHDSRRNDIRHVTEVVVLCYTEFGIGIELTDCSKMYITPRTC